MKYSSIFIRVLRFLKRRLLVWRRRQLARRDWRVRHARVFARHPEYQTACDPQIEQEHLRLWRRLRRDVPLDTLRVCAGVSGVASPWYVPEEVFVSEIEPWLNRYPQAQFLARKNGYERWFGPGIFPRSFLHKVDGLLFNTNYEQLTEGMAQALLEELVYPVVVKPSLGAFGGRDVTFAESAGEVWKSLNAGPNWVVQQRVVGHPFFAKFSPVGLNTLRVYCYRSVRSNAMQVLNVALRLGLKGSLDNETAGGLVCFVRDNGDLNGGAVDKYGGRFERHPDNDEPFTGTIPKFEEMKHLALKLARDVWYARLVGLDMALDADGNWRCIEINLRAQTIRFAQYAGHPFFGKFTNEVIECLRE